MSAAPSWPLVFVALQGGAPSKRDCRHARVVFRSISKVGSRIQAIRVLNLFFRPLNAKQRAERRCATARQIHFFTDCKSPKLPNLPTAPRRETPLPTLAALSCCRPDMG